MSLSNTCSLEEIQENLAGFEPRIVGRCLRTYGLNDQARLKELAQGGDEARALWWVDELARAKHCRFEDNTEILSELRELDRLRQARDRVAKAMELGIVLSLIFALTPLVIHLAA